MQIFVLSLNVKIVQGAGAKDVIDGIMSNKNR